MHYALLHIKNKFGEMQTEKYQIASINLLEQR